MFLIDKYKPENTGDFAFHKEKLNKLSMIVDKKSIPHIIFYGPEGSGKKTMVRYFLELQYGSNVNIITESIYEVAGSGNSKKNVKIKQSAHHIIIEPNNNNFDRYLIQEVVKKYAMRKPLALYKKVVTNTSTTNTHTTPEYISKHKTVFIKNVDNLSYYAQTSLRRTLEKYSKTCKFIMSTKSLSKVIDPLQSRCYCFRVEAPTKLDIYGHMLYITAMEEINLKYDDFDKILDKSQRNIKKALWGIDLIKYNNSLKTSYDSSLKIIHKLILKTKRNSIPDIRKYIYDILETNIHEITIIKDIINNLLLEPSISDIVKYDIIKMGSKCEHNLVRGRREIMHIEKFIIHVMHILYNIKK